MYKEIRSGNESFKQKTSSKCQMTSEKLEIIKMKAKIRKKIPGRIKVENEQPQLL